MDAANQPPTQPGNPSPAEGANNQPVNTHLSWSACSDPDNDPVTYDVYFGPDPDPPLVGISLMDTMYTTRNFSL